MANLVLSTFVDTSSHKKSHWPRMVVNGRHMKRGKAILNKWRKRDDYLWPKHRWKLNIRKKYNINGYLQRQVAKRSWKSKTVSGWWNIQDEDNSWGGKIIWDRPSKTERTKQKKFRSFHRASLSLSQWETNFPIDRIFFVVQH